MGMVPFTDTCQKSARLYRRDGCHRCACPQNSAASPRGRCVRTHARKGFGTALPRLPSLGGKGKVPAGGVAPSPPIDLGIPGVVERQWANARDEWKQRCIEHPVVLPAQGAQVYLIPVGADLPADAAFIRDVVAAVQPDAIALESPPQASELPTRLQTGAGHLKSYTSIAKALEPQITQLLSSSAADALHSPSAARTCFTQHQREELQSALLQACRGASVKPDPEQLTHLFRLGSLPFVEWLVPAHLVRTSSSSSKSSFLSKSMLNGVGGLGGIAQQRQQQPMLLLSCGLDRQARAMLPAASLFFGREFDVYLEEVEAALGDEVAGEVIAWRSVLGDRLEACGAGRELATLLTAWEAQCCLGPEQQRQVAVRVEKRMGEEGEDASGSSGGVGLEMVRTAADSWVARRLVELAVGKDVVRRCQRIVAVVGRVHVLSVEEELMKIAEAGAR
ncbi:hypothetical protein VOLCADRAFT_96365 [Volvox carteri f. nagariensis]|uniref:Uncharacterized protein n=1 Tax=Volvox carteri f. nagariensis TaxID=3068 RepID=D8U9X6_VOLCA|nr:uncharacterized protein VOLCADRAFT_96365 [Volvox carteri f. nagariensis]EFJ43486.1 hypothetical protein VOLCADRAFT_96365 [Volvox carteri f. nagariensis]|eukprot:XP_002955415.1 hypothetical protein VOLCADRAFT_96365 [Volvox carteri f. nagariensis]